MQIAEAALERPVAQRSRADVQVEVLHDAARLLSEEGRRLANVVVDRRVDAAAGHGVLLRSVERVANPQLAGLECRFGHRQVVLETGIVGERGFAGHALLRAGDEGSLVDCPTQDTQHPTGVANLGKAQHTEVVHRAAPMTGVATEAEGPVGRDG